MVKFSKIGRYLCLIASFLFCFSGAEAQHPLDSIEASLLTCSPGTEVYSLYGHTALRIRNYTRNYDVAFNYGVFSFKTPHFAWRFTLGECDYEVDAIPFPYFVREYKHRGSSVDEQLLNLTQEEANRLFYLLCVNLQPENRKYRYNYLTNNCTTRVRDIIEEAIDGSVVYREKNIPQTYRQMMHRFTKESAWAELGNDILLGAACDTLLSDRASMFLPDMLESYFDEAQIADSLGNLRALVKGKNQVVAPGIQDTQKGFPVSPFVLGVCFVLCSLLIFCVEYRTKRMWWLFDAVVLFLQGLAGCLLCFMFFFSLHPTLDSNWQIWVLNPLPLLCMPWVVCCARKSKKCFYHVANLLSLTLFLILTWWIPQEFAKIIVSLALGFIIRSLSYVLNYRRR